MKIVVGLAFVCFLLSTFAARVEWNAFDILYEGGDAEVCFYGIDDTTGEASRAYICLESVRTGTSVQIASCPAYPETRCAWVLAALGTVLDEEYFNNLDSYFFRYGLYGNTVERHDYDLELNVRDSVYLAVMTTNNKSPTIEFNYGWLELELAVDGTLYAVNSALGLDGQRIVVGGDSVIPEPSSCLLMLIGISALGLRRRCRM